MLEILWDKIVSFWNSPDLFWLVADNRFFLILLVIFLMRAKYAVYESMWLSALVNIPGTFLHEFMHYWVGLLFNARPVNFNLWPKRDLSGYYVMGSVGFQNITYYNALPASMAPLLLLPLGYWINHYLLPMLPMNLSRYVLYVLLQTIIIENALPSRADFRIAGMFFSGILIYGTLILALLWYW